ncbi:hypothetical protein GJ496_011095 [Pomphorhynchus laevis]|nr:hypothetical protein GJ496_011095 [Pomphorhynchus laevis]
MMQSYDPIIYNFADLLKNSNRSSLSEERIFTRQWGSDFTDYVKPDSRSKSNLYKSLHEYISIFRNFDASVNLDVATGSGNAIPPAPVIPDFLLQENFLPYLKHNFLYIQMNANNFPKLLDEINDYLFNIMGQVNPEISLECRKLQRLASSMWIKHSKDEHISMLQMLQKNLKNACALLKLAVKYQRACHLQHLLTLIQIYRDGTSLVGHHQGAIQMLSQFGYQGQDVKVLQVMRSRINKLAKEKEEKAVKALCRDIDNFLNSSSSDGYDIGKSLNEVWSVERAVECVADTLVLFVGRIFRNTQLSSRSQASIQQCIQLTDSTWDRVCTCIDECKLYLPREFSAEFDRHTLPVCLEIMQSALLRKLNLIINDIDSICLLGELVHNKLWCNNLITAWLRSTFTSSVGNLDEKLRKELSDKLNIEKWTGELVELSDDLSTDKFVVSRCAKLLYNFMNTYEKLFKRSLWILQSDTETSSGCDVCEEDWRVHWLELVNFFNSRTCQLLIGAGSVETANLKSINIRHMAVGYRSLQLVDLLFISSGLCYQQCHCINRKVSAKLTQQCGNCSSKQIYGNLKDHQNKLFDKIVDISTHFLRKEIVVDLQRVPNTFDPLLTQICKRIKSISDQIVNIFSKEDYCSYRLFLQGVLLEDRSGNRTCVYCSEMSANESPTAVDDDQGFEACDVPFDNESNGEEERINFAKIVDKCSYCKTRYQTPDEDSYVEMQCLKRIKMIILNHIETHITSTPSSSCSMIQSYIQMYKDLDEIFLKHSSKCCSNK